MLAINKVLPRVKKYFLKTSLGFTLVELIVVIAILSMLGILGFMNIQGYHASARDSVRISALSTFYKGFRVAHMKGVDYPNPEQYANIVGVSKQGYIGNSIARVIKIYGSIKDPLDGTDYIYALDPTGKKIQLSAFLEENNPRVISTVPNLINGVYASNIDYTKRFLYSIGDKVGILLDSQTKSPINTSVSTGTLDLSTDSGSYVAVFSNTSTNSGVISGTGQDLLTHISIIQNSCVIGNTVVTSGGQIQAYNTQNVPYNQVCVPVMRTCNSGVLSGDSGYKYDACSPRAALNCSTTTQSGYIIPEIAHLSTQNVVKNIVGGTSDISVSCLDGVLSYGAENINCSTNYVLDGDQCKPDVCIGSAPVWSISNGIQKFNTPWTHNTNPGQCTYVCQSGYYSNASLCIPANIGHIVSSSGQISQDPCDSSSTYQDTEGQSACKNVSVGYYSTPAGSMPHTGQVQCEANSYCINGIKTTCNIGYSSPVGSSSAGACTINSYAVSGSFGANANGATVNICGKTTTAGIDGSFSVAANYGTVCNNATVTRTGYTCAVTTNGPTSLTNTFSSVAGNCVANTQSVACGGSVPANATTTTVATYTQTWNGTAWAPILSWTNNGSSCGFTCKSTYTWNGSICAENRVTVTLSIANVNNYNIFANRGGTYVAGRTDVVVNVSGTIGSVSVATPALDTGVGWSADDTITIVNNGTIIGATGATGAYGIGGAGGAGATESIAAKAGSPGSAGGAGGTGGVGLLAQRAVRITNNGTISGGNGGAGGLGGGGGGGGGGRSCGYSCSGNGGAGGKGQGSAAAVNGSTGQSCQYQTSGGQWQTFYGGSGGAGGAYGAAGIKGGCSGGAGGAAGATGSAGARGVYVSGNANVTWLATGTRTGTVN